MVRSYAEETDSKKGPVERKLGEFRELKVTLCGTSIERGHLGRGWERVLRSSDECGQDEVGADHGQPLSLKRELGFHPEAQRNMDRFEIGQ